MVKQKTFLFSTLDVGDFISAGNIIWDESVINRKIDKFLKDKELVSVSTSCICRGNNPPRYALVYTVVYNEEVPIKEVV